MSWIHAFCPADFTRYAVWSRHYEELDWRLDQHQYRYRKYLTGLDFPKAEATLNVIQSDFTEGFESERGLGELPIVLHTLLKDQKSEIKRGTARFLEQAERELLHKRLGLSIETIDSIAEQIEELASAYKVTQHLSEDDPDYVLAKILIDLSLLLQDTAHKYAEGIEYFSEPSGIHYFKTRLNALIQRSDYPEQLVQDWIQAFQSQLKSRDDAPTSSFHQNASASWQIVFGATEKMINTAHGLFIFLEAKAHNDWDENKQKDWLESLKKRSEIDQKIFSRANFIKAKVFKDYLTDACALGAYAYANN
jgi:hypothetical protein